MGNSNSTPTMKFYNCAGLNMTIASPSNGSKTLKPPNLDCINTSFPYEVGNYSISFGTSSYTLLGSSITTYGYTIVTFWNSITLGDSMDDSVFCGSNQECTKGKNLGPGLHVSFNSQITVNNLDNTLTQIPFANVLVDTVPTDPIPPDGNPPPPQPTPTTNGSSNAWIFILIITVVIVIAITIVGIVYMKLKNANTTTSTPIQ